MIENIQIQGAFQTQWLATTKIRFLKSLLYIIKDFAGDKGVCPAHYYYYDMFLKQITITFLALLVFSSCAFASPVYRVDLNSNKLPPGGVALFRLSSDNKACPPTWAHSVKTFLDAGQVFVTHDESGVWGVVAIDLETSPGKYPLRLVVDESVAQTTVEVVDARYGAENVKVPSSMVNLDTKTVDRVLGEAKILKKIWARTTSPPLWDGPFILPLDGRISAKFGTRRTMNGQKKKPHSGMDIAAPYGSTVRAANSGRVALVGNFYFIGNFVIIEHGLGVFTLYAHLSKILLKQGMDVTKGAPVGEVGSTGRSTGPHLHFAVKIGETRVSPKLLFALIKELTLAQASKGAKGRRKDAVPLLPVQSSPDKSGQSSGS